MAMFIAMNRFKVVKGSEQAFEEVWSSRETYLDELDGFISFHLLRGPEKDDHTLYSSHTIWSSYEAFQAWTKSEQFRKAHANAGRNDGLYNGHPEFEGFTVVQEETSAKSQADAAA